jgi:hypothetical protein
MKSNVFTTARSFFHLSSYQWIFLVCTRQIYLVWAITWGLQVVFQQGRWSATHRPKPEEPKLPFFCHYHRHVVFTTTVHIVYLHVTVWFLMFVLPGLENWSVAMLLPALFSTLSEHAIPCTTKWWCSYWETHKLKRYLSYSWQWRFKLRSPRLGHCPVMWKDTSVSEDLAATIFWSRQPRFSNMMIPYCNTTQCHNTEDIHLNANLSCMQRVI